MYLIRRGNGGRYRNNRTTVCHADGGADTGNQEDRARNVAVEASRYKAMTNLPAERLQRRILWFSVLAVMLTGLLVSAIGVYPLATTLRQTARDSLVHARTLESVALTQYARSLTQIARQIASRSAIRDALIRYQDGEMSRPDLVAFTTPKLQDALVSTPSVKAIIHASLQVEPLVSVGTAIPPESYAALKGRIWSSDKDLWISQPWPVDGALWLMVAVPVLDTRPTLQPSSRPAIAGIDIVAFDSNELVRILRDHHDSPYSLTMSLSFGNIAGDDSPLWFGLNGNRALAEVAPPPRASSHPLLDGETDDINGIAYTVGNIDGTNWQLAMALPTHVLYQDLYRVLWMVTLSMAALMLGGTFGLVVILRPLQGHLLVHTRDLEDQIEVLRGLGRQLEVERQRLSDSNQELEQFAYAASHDLQQPLRMIAGFLELLRRRYNDKLDDDGREFIAFAVTGAERMRAMIADLLEYSRVGRLEQALRPVDMNISCQHALQNLAVRISESNAAIQTAALPQVLAEPAQMVRLLQNLIDNALKYRSPERTPQISIRATEEGELWHIEVRDNGIGIDPGAQKQAFRLFQRLHPHLEQEGTGMGLAMCAKIVSRHGGRIWLESEPDVGTSIHFTLPAARTE